MQTLPRFSKVLRYLVAGGSAAAVNLTVYFLCTEYAHIWYVLASVYAFLTAFLVSFLLQKYWTFKEHTHALVKKQLVMYLVTAGINILVGAALLYMFVEYANVHHLFAQVLSQGIIAFFTYFIYKHLIFKA